MFISNSKSREMRFAIFIFTTFLHIVILAAVYFNPLFFLIIIFEFVYFTIYSFSLNRLLSIIFILFIIFVLNVFSYDGKIFVEFLFVKITYDGLYVSLKKIGLLFGLFLFTNNLLSKNRDLFIWMISQKTKNNLVVNSINYFFYFFEIIERKYLNIKKIFVIFIKIVKKNSIIKKRLIIR
ncbi:MAG TPA: hypothetical protein PK771_03760 [Spirochaetota bacterium]|nr:hypothetical protein [Spirochaetota bacterium]